MSVPNDDQMHLETRWKTILQEPLENGKGNSSSCWKSPPDSRYLTNFRADPMRSSTGLVDGYPVSANKSALVTEVCVTG